VPRCWSRQRSTEKSGIRRCYVVAKAAVSLPGNGAQHLCSSIEGERLHQDSTGLVNDLDILRTIVRYKEGKIKDLGFRAFTERLIVKNNTSLPNLPQSEKKETKKATGARSCPCGSLGFYPTR
jgi:hypothetical protein